MPTQRLHAWLDVGTPYPGPPGLPRVIHDEGVPLPVRTVIDMRGAGVTATDDPGGDRTVITIPGQTPWTQNIDAALFDLNSVGVVRFSSYTGGPGPDAGIGNEAGTLHILTDNGGSVNIESFGNGRVMVSTDGTRRLVVHQGGNVGIGPSMNPDYKLDVQGDVNSSGVYRVNGQPHTHAWADLTGKPASFPPAAHTHPWGEITGIPSNVSSAVPNTTQIIAGAGLSGGGALTGNVTLSANIAGIQTPWLQNIDGNGKSLSGARSISVTGVNAGGAESFTAITLDRPYGDVGDSIDIVWPGVARIQTQATGGGEAGFVFHAQTGAGDGTNNQIARLLGNGSLVLPKASLDVYRGTPNGYINTPGAGGSWMGTFIDYIDQPYGGVVIAMNSLGGGFAHSALTVGSVNAAHGGFREWFGIRSNGTIVLWLGGALKTLSVDGSGFVKAT